MSQLQRAFDYYNRHLFQSKLPQCMLLMHRMPKAKGYFWPQRWSDRVKKRRLHEIALNPDEMSSRDDRDVLSTLVHEQVHLWQEAFGTPPTSVYHNAEWADKMEEVGLMPSTTGQPGGRRTGKWCSHYILGGQRFDLLTDKLLSTGFEFDWTGITESRTTVTGKTKKGKEAETEGKAGKRLKYVCPGCSVSVRGKSGLQLACIGCEVAFEETTT